MIRRTAILTIVAASCTSCASYYYKEPSHSEAHAVVMFAESTSPSAPDLKTRGKPVEVNGLETGYRYRELRVPAGLVSMNVRAHSSARVAGSAMINFDAVRGETYIVSSEIDVKHVTFELVDSNGTELYAKRVEKHLVPETTVTTVPIYIPAVD